MQSFSQTHNYSKDLNVLYVEDNLAILESTGNLFKDFFNSVATAVDGVDGLEKYIAYKNETSQYYDLIITDINMPRKSGLEMIKDIKELNHKQAIIVISAYDDSIRLMELIREGISNFITKPIIPDQLMEIIYKVSQSIYGEKIQDEFIIGQSKLASMGEMMDTIAHQWLGPINLIKMQVELLEMELDDGVLNKEDITECAQKQSLQIEHILDTLSEFRAFFRPSDKLVVTSYKDIIDSTLLLMKDKIMFHTVDIEINTDENIQIEVMKNEFKHVLMNIISNAIDEFENNKIKNPKLIINSFVKDDMAILEIIDNAGGVPEKIIDKIFEANFTTKAETSGTGMGLHLVSLILQKVKGKITVENVADGASFSIALKNNAI